MKLSDPCPCGSGHSYESCCARYHLGGVAPSAEALMRSRYSAYILKLSDYLHDSWHISTRPARHLLDNDEAVWCGLDIRQTSKGREGDETGEVEFIARWLVPGGRAGALHERSRFVLEGGRWYYLDGVTFPTASSKVGRNDPCPCGSGRKLKQCCGR